MRRKKFSCDYLVKDGKRCGNKPYREVYSKKSWWSYLCRKHFNSEKRRRPRPFFAWCKA